MKLDNFEDEAFPKMFDDESYLGNEDDEEHLKYCNKSSILPKSNLSL
jgi:hypothetical protein